MTVTTTLQSDSLIVYRSKRRVAYFDRSLPADLIEQLWQAPASLLANGENLRKKNARHTVRLEWQSQPLVLKHYVEPTRRHALKQLVLPSRAWKTWDFTHRLLGLGVATPRPVACIENRWGALRRDSFLMYQYVEGETLRHRFYEAKKSPEVYDRLFKQVSELWQRLVDLGVGLNDTHLGNFIVGPDGELWLIDLDKSCFYTNRDTAAPHQARAWKQLLRSVAAA